MLGQLIPQYRLLSYSLAVRLTESSSSVDSVLALLCGLSSVTEIEPESPIGAVLLVFPLPGGQLS